MDTEKLRELEQEMRQGIDWSGGMNIERTHAQWADRLRDILAAQPPKAEVSAVEVFRIAGGDTECCPNPTAEVALDCLRDLRARYDEAITATPTAAADSEDAKALKRVDAILREFEGMTGAGYKYMAANIRAAIKGPDAAHTSEARGAAWSGAVFERGYSAGYRAALGAASAECRRIGEALDGGGNTYVRYEDAIKCAVSVGRLSIPAIDLETFDPAWVVAALKWVATDESTCKLSRREAKEQARLICAMYNLPVDAAMRQEGGNV